MQAHRELLKHSQSSQAKLRATGYTTMFTGQNKPAAFPSYTSNILGAQDLPGAVSRIAVHLSFTRVKMY